MIPVAFKKMELSQSILFLKNTFHADLIRYLGESNRCKCNKADVLNTFLCL